MAELTFRDVFPAHSEEHWRQAASALLKGRPLEKLWYSRFDGARDAPILFSRPPETASHQANQAPYVRGLRVFERRRAGWDIRALYEHGPLDDARALIKYELQRGVRSLWIKPDSRGFQDLKIDSAEALDTLLADVDLKATPISIDAGAQGTSLHQFANTVLSQRGLSPSETHLSVLFDPLGELLTRGQVKKDLSEHWQDLNKTIHELTAAEAHSQCLLVNTVPAHEAGAHPIQELALMCGLLTETLRGLQGLEGLYEKLAQRGLIRLSVGRDMFYEVAKVRAARLLVAKLLKACGAPAEACNWPIHAVTSSRTQSQRDPWVNLLRGTAEAFAAVLGGADIVTVLPFDRVLGVPAKLGRRMATNTQLLLEQESYLNRVVDPAGGSYLIEQLTMDMARAAWKEFQSIEAEGGAVAALHSGSLRQRIQEAVTRRRRSMGHRKTTLVGVSDYAHLDEAKLSQSAPPGLKDFGLGSLSPVRWSQPWEALRDRSDAYKAKHGERPRVFMARLGPIPVHKPRSDFTERLLAAAGFECMGPEDGFADKEALKTALEDPNLRGQLTWAALCSSQELYEQWLPEAAQWLRDAGVTKLLLAGRPDYYEYPWREAGITDFIYMGSDVLATMTDWQSSLEDEA